MLHCRSSHCRNGFVHKTCAKQKLDSRPDWTGTGQSRLVRVLPKSRFLVSPGPFFLKKGSGSFAGAHLSTCGWLSARTGHTCTQDGSRHGHIIQQCSVSCAALRLPGHPLLLCVLIQAKPPLAAFNQHDSSPTSSWTTSSWKLKFKAGLSKPLCRTSALSWQTGHSKLLRGRTASSWLPSSS